jgi:tRNA C32,U32 (ribose-2'-O)-methylase TrmJ
MSYIMTRKDKTCVSDPKKLRAYFRRSLGKWASVKDLERLIEKWRPFLAERGYLHEEEQAKIKIRMRELKARAKEKGIKLNWTY